MEGLEGRPALTDEHPSDRDRHALALVILTALDELTIGQQRIEQPTSDDLLTELSRNGAEVSAQAIGGNSVHPHEKHRRGA